MSAAITAAIVLAWIVLLVPAVLNRDGARGGSTGEASGRLGSAVRIVAGRSRGRGLGGRRRGRRLASPSAREQRAEVRGGRRRVRQHTARGGSGLAATGARRRRRVLVGAFAAVVITAVADLALHGRHHLLMLQAAADVVLLGLVVILRRLAVAERTLRRRAAAAAAASVSVPVAAAAAVGQPAPTAEFSPSASDPAPVAPPQRTAPTVTVAPAVASRSLRPRRPDLVDVRDLILGDAVSADPVAEAAGDALPAAESQLPSTGPRIGTIVLERPARIGTPTVRRALTSYRLAASRPALLEQAVTPERGDTDRRGQNSAGSDGSHPDAGSLYEELLARRASGA